MHKSMNRSAFALQVAEVLRVCGDFNGNELIGPDMVARPPDVAERAATDFGLENIFADALVNRGHFDSILCAAWELCFRLSQSSVLFHFFRDPIAGQQIIDRRHQAAENHKRPGSPSADGPAKEPT